MPAGATREKKQRGGNDAESKSREACAALWRPPARKSTAGRGSLSRRWCKTLPVFCSNGLLQDQLSSGPSKAREYPGGQHGN